MLTGSHFLHVSYCMHSVKNNYDTTMNQNNTKKDEYIEAEIIESQPLSDSKESYQNQEYSYHPPKNSNKGCYLIIGCFFIFLIGLITVIGTILGFFTDILISIF